MARPSRSPRPIGRLPGGEPYYAPVGEMRYDGDRVQCHLCGRWLKWVGGTHLARTHGWTIEQYRDTFRLPRNVSTVAPETGGLKRAQMLEQIRTGQRDQSAIPRGIVPATVGAWRSVAVLRPELLVEWHPTRNADLDPYEVGVHSKRRVGWRCRECGHEWAQSPKARSQGNGCPACARRRSIAALIEHSRATVAPERSLAAIRPDLLAEWHPTRNAGLDPNAVAAGARQKVWWRCNECGHQWSAAVGERTRPRRPHGCPACALARQGAREAYNARREQSLAALYPQLAAEWHPTRNAALDPFAVRPGSNRRVSWRCAECGHEWQAAPVDRRRNPRGLCGTCAHRRGQRERGTKPLSRHPERSARRTR